MQDTRFAHIGVVLQQPEERAPLSRDTEEGVERFGLDPVEGLKREIVYKPCLRKRHLKWLPPPFSNLIILILFLFGMIGILISVGLSYRKLTRAREQPGVKVSSEKIDSFPLFDVVVCSNLNPREKELARLDDYYTVGFDDGAIPNDDSPTMDDDDGITIDDDNTMVDDAIPNDDNTTMDDDFYDDTFFYMDDDSSNYMDNDSSIGNDDGFLGNQTFNTSDASMTHCTERLNLCVQVNSTLSSGSLQTKFPAHKGKLLGEYHQKSCLIVSNNVTLKERKTNKNNTDTNKKNTNTNKNNTDTDTTITMTIYHHKRATVSIALVAVNEKINEASENMRIPAGHEQDIYFRLSSAVDYTLKKYFFSWKRLFSDISEDHSSEFYSKSTTIVTDTQIAYDAPVDDTNTDRTVLATSNGTYGHLDLENYAISYMYFSPSRCDLLQSIRTEYYTYGESEARDSYLTYFGLVCGTLIPILVVLPSLLEIIITLYRKHNPCQRRCRRDVQPVNETISE